MSIESGPKPDETTEIPKPESEHKESIVLNFDAIKNIIISQIGSKAEINRLEIEEVAEGAKLSAEIDAGMLGGQISIEGYIVNDQNEIAIRDLNIDARGYVKSRIESSLSSFGPAIKKYFERQYGKSVSGISIAGSNLIIELKDSDTIPTSESAKISPEKLERCNKAINYIKSLTDQPLPNPMFRFALERVSNDIQRVIDGKNSLANVKSHMTTGGLVKSLLKKYPVHMGEIYKILELDEQ